MLIGVVSDTHNNQKNIDKIITIFNQEKVDFVIHTGDIASSKALEQFSKLNCKLIGVYGNNDREEIGLNEVAKRYNFNFQEPPYSITIQERSIVIFHEPDQIDCYLEKNKDIDIILHGHTHRYRNESKDGVLIFNPGESAGMLKGRNALGFVNLKNLAIKRIFF